MPRLLSACALVVLAAPAFAADAPSPIDAIKELGGKAQTDPTRDGNPVLKVVLTGDKITDRHLDLLAGFTELEELDLAGAKVTNAGLAKLKGLLRLENLNLARTLVTDEGLAALRPLGNLRVLNLEKAPEGEYSPATRFTDRALPHLKAMPKLRSLTMDWNMLTDEGMAAVLKMRHLREVRLGIQSKATSEGREGVSRALKERRD
ncbi:MAG: hypothetical protein K2W96_13980 [Gemmataceae bacterium]|nr:hypothetical protein [Gemmataceae bacterium]